MDYDDECPFTFQAVANALATPRREVDKVQPSNPPVMAIQPAIAAQIAHQNPPVLVPKTEIRANPNLTADLAFQSEPDRVESRLNTPTPNSSVILSSQVSDMFFYWNLD